MTQAMRLQNSTAELFIPDRVTLNEALKRSTYMGIGAHHDDLELMAYDGILRCFGQKNRSFFGITVTDDEIALDRVFTAIFLMSK